MRNKKQLECFREYYSYYESRIESNDKNYESGRTAELLGSTWARMDYNTRGVELLVARNYVARLYQDLNPKLRLATVIRLLEGT